jgi:anti-sigma regulatory factor (Ser/Thr protein kinase)
MKAIRRTGLGATLTAATLAAALVGTAACGQSRSEKQAEETKKAIEEATRNAEDAGKSAGEAAKQASKGMEEFAKGLSGMAGAMAGNKDGKPIEPVSFRDLQGVFVPLNGWEMGKPTGEKITVPFAYSQAKVKYRKDDARIEITVTDSGMNQLMLAPFSMFLTTGYEKETENGYEKSEKVGGFPGWEKWNSSNKSGEVNAFVNKRFLVQIEGDNLADTKVLHQLADASNLAKLASIQ